MCGVSPHCDCATSNRIGFARPSPGLWRRRRPRANRAHRNAFGVGRARAPRAGGRGWASVGGRARARGLARVGGRVRACGWVRARARARPQRPSSSSPPPPPVGAARRRRATRGGGGRGRGEGELSVRRHGDRGGGHAARAHAGAFRNGQDRGAGGRPGQGALLAVRVVGGKWEELGALPLREVWGWGRRPRG